MKCYNFYSLDAERDLHQSLTRFIQEVGIPNIVISDDSNAKAADGFSTIASVNHIRSMLIMTISPWQNQAETLIREVKRQPID
jgi:hypothetical protein